MLEMHCLCLVLCSGILNRWKKCSGWMDIEVAPLWSNAVYSESVQLCINPPCNKSSWLDDNGLSNDAMVKETLWHATTLCYKGCTWVCLTVNFAHWTVLWHSSWDSELQVNGFLRCFSGNEFYFSEAASNSVETGEKSSRGFACLMNFGGSKVLKIFIAKLQLTINLCFRGLYCMKLSKV